MVFLLFMKNYERQKGQRARKSALKKADDRPRKIDRPGRGRAAATAAAARAAAARVTAGAAAAQITAAAPAEAEGAAAESSGGAWGRTHASTLDEARSWGKAQGRVVV